MFVFLQTQFLRLENSNEYWSGGRGKGGGTGAGFFPFNPFIDSGDKGGWEGFIKYFILRLEKSEKGGRVSCF